MNENSKKKNRLFYHNALKYRRGEILWMKKRRKKAKGIMKQKKQ